MKLILNTGDEFELREGSTVGCMVIECSEEQAKEVQSKITTQTLNGATLEGAKLTNVVLENITVGTSETEDCFITISCHQKTTDEIILERLKEQSIALCEIAEMVASK